MANQLDDPDYSWFSRKEYELQHRLDIAGWAAMLNERVTLKEKYQHHVASRSDIPERKQFWDEYCKSVSVSTFLKKKHDRKGLAFPSGSSPLMEVTSELLLPDRRERTIGVFMGLSGYRALLVNPWADYEDLKKRFDQWLRELRQEFGSPFKRRGRPGTNLGVTKLHLSSWAYHSILAVFDLDFYTEVFAKKPLSRSALHEKIRPTAQEDPAEWAKTARHLVKQVVDGREFLRVQAQHGAK